MSQSMKGLTLIELLIVIAIIGILAAVLVPNLLSARARAFDAATQACLKEVGTMQEAVRSESPFVFDPTFDPDTIATCAGVSFSEETVTDTFFSYTGEHDRGATAYRVQTGTSVRRVP